MGRRRRGWGAFSTGYLLEIVVVVLVMALLILLMIELID